MLNKELLLEPVFGYAIKLRIIPSAQLAQNQMLWAGVGSKTDF